MTVKLKVINSFQESNINFSLSVSKAQTFDSCKAKYRYSYIEKLPRKEWDFHVFGTFMHEVLEEFHSSLIKDPNQVLIELMRHHYNLIMPKYKDKLSIAQLKESKDIIKTYLDIILNDEKPSTVIQVEKPFIIELDDLILLNGYIDRVQKDYDGTLHVADYKTTKNKKYIKDFFQLMTYAFVLMLEDPTLQKIKASFIMLRHNFEFITKEFSRDEVFETVTKKFLMSKLSIDSEKLWRPNPQFLCKYCDYLEKCNAGNTYLIKKGLAAPKKPTFGTVKW